MSTPIIIGGGPPPQKRISTWVGGAAVAVGVAALNSPEVTQSIINVAKSVAGDNAIGASLVLFGTQQALLAARRWLQAKARKR